MNNFKFAAIPNRITKTVNRLLISILVVCLLIISTVHAGEWRDFLANHNRPTVAQFLSKGDLPSTNPFTPIISNDERVSNLIATGAELINELEFAFPNAVWAPLGRDSSLVGDLLEAFYLKLNQPNRVVRLNASGNSFATASQNMIIGFLKTAGLVNEKGIPIKDFVIIDPTSWNTTSQSRRLMTAIYNSIPKTEHSEFLRHVNVIALGGVSGSISANNVISPSFDKEAFLNHVRVDSYGPSHIPSVQGAPAYIPHDSRSREIAWHDKFGYFTESKGEVVAQPGSFFSDRAEHVLWEMYELTKAAQSPEFLMKVNDIAINTYKRPFPIHISSSSLARAFEIIGQQRPQGSPLVQSEIDSYLAQPLMFTQNKDMRELTWLIALSSVEVYSNQQLLVLERFVQHLTKMKQSQDSTSLIVNFSKSYPDQMKNLESNLTTLLSLNSSQSSNIVGKLQILAPYFKEVVQTLVKEAYLDKTTTIADIPKLLEVHSSLGDVAFDSTQFQTQLLSSQISLSTSQYLSLVNKLPVRLQNEFFTLTSSPTFFAEMLSRSASETESDSILKQIESRLLTDANEREVILSYLSKQHPKVFEQFQSTVNALCQALPTQDPNTVQKLARIYPLFRDSFHTSIKNKLVNPISTLEEFETALKIQLHFSNPVLSSAHIIEKVVQLFPNNAAEKVNQIKQKWTSFETALPGISIVNNMLLDLTKNPIILAAPLVSSTTMDDFASHLSELETPATQISIHNLLKATPSHKSPFYRLLRQAALQSFQFNTSHYALRIGQLLANLEDQAAICSLAMDTSIDRTLLLQTFSVCSQFPGVIEKLTPDAIETIQTFPLSVYDYNTLIQFVSPNSRAHQILAGAALQTLHTKEDFKVLKKPESPSDPDYIKAEKRFKKLHSSLNLRTFVSFFKRLNPKYRRSNLEIETPRIQPVDRSNLQPLFLWQVKIAASEALAEDRLFLRLDGNNGIKAHLKELIQSGTASDLSQAFQSDRLPHAYYVNLVARSKGVRRQYFNSPKEDSSVKTNKNADGLSRLIYNLSNNRNLNSTTIVRNTLQQQSMPLLTHYDILSLLAERIPLEEQKDVYALLAPLIYTRLEFYPQAIQGPYLEKISPEALKQIETDSKAENSYIGQAHAAQFPGAQFINQRRLLTLLSANLSKTNVVTAEQLVELLLQIPTETVSPQSEKDLLPLRDKLREFLQNKSWTASDLYHMGVSLNLVFALKVVDRFQELSLSVPKSIQLKTYITNIFEKSNIQEIESNPDKPHLKSLKTRQINREGIQAYINHLLTSLNYE